MDDAKFEEIIKTYSPTRKRANEKIPKEKVSAWLSVIPTARYHFDLSAREFRDALAIRYRRPLLGVPSNCDGCGEEFTLVHALDCKRCGLVTQRHNEIRDAIGDLASLVWKEIKREPVVREADYSSDGRETAVAATGLLNLP